MIGAPARTATKRRMSVALLTIVAAASAARSQEAPKDVIAAHLRLQGYECDAPKSARRDAQASRPDAQVWLIACEKARYRVRLVPDMMDVVAPY